MNTQVIYTKNNWAMIKHLFPNGTTKANTYTVWLDCDSHSYRRAMDLLHKHSEYLACIVHSYSECGVVIFSKGF